jgi:hypothetical protein
MDQVKSLLRERAILIGLGLVVYIGKIVILPLWLYAVLFDPDRARNMLFASDCFYNAAFNGDPHQTISLRAYFGTQAGSKRWCLLCKFLAYFQKNHCELTARNAGVIAPAPAVTVPAVETPRFDSVPLSNQPPSQ